MGSGSREMWELSWRDTGDLIIMQHSGISFSVLVSGRDYPWLFLICSLSDNVFEQSSSSVRTLCFISIKRSYKPDQVLELSVRQFSSQLAWMQLCAWSCCHDTVRLLQLHTGIAAGRICSCPDSFCYSERRALFSSVVPWAWAFPWLCPDLAGWQWALMLWQADLERGLLLMTSELSCFCGIWEESFGIALWWRSQKHQAEKAAVWQWLDLPMGRCPMGSATCRSRGCLTAIGRMVLPLMCMVGMGTACTVGISSTGRKMEGLGAEHCWGWHCLGLALGLQGRSWALLWFCQRGFQSGIRWLQWFFLYFNQRK